MLKVFEYYFRKEYVDRFITDVGVWNLELTNTEGKIYLSDLVRDAVGMNDLYVFDVG